MRITLTALTPTGPRDLVVSGDDRLTVGQVAAELRGSVWPREELAEVIPLPGAEHGSWASRRQAHARGGTLWVNARPLDPGAEAARALHDGDVVAADQQTAPATMLDEPSGTVEIRAVGGPVAGTVRRLGLGAATLGGSRDCQVPVPGLPPHAARITVSRGVPEPGVTLEPAGAGSVPVQLLMDGEEVTAARPWPPGALVEAGPHVLALSLPEQPDAHLSPAGDGGLAYNRPPRLWPASRPRRIEVPSEPRRGEKVRLQLLAALIPLVLGVVMWVALKSAMYALFMLMSPVMVIGQWMSDRRHGKTSHKQAMREYRQKLTELEPRLAAAQAADEAERRIASPDPAEVLLTATGPRRRLWERRAHDPDTLHLRVGLTSQTPVVVQIVAEKGSPPDAELPPPPLARNVPVPLPLPLLGVLGLAGPPESSRGLARWLVGQAAALHSPRDLEIVVLSSDPEAGRHWNWVRWLPHCAPRKGEACIALVGSDPASAGRRVAELAAEVTERLEKARNLPGAVAGGMADEERPASPDLGPKILVVLDGARVLRRIPGMPQVLAAARRTGVYAICIDESERMLPEECAAVASWDPELPACVNLRGGGLDVLGRVLADQVSPAWADRMARAMAPVRDVSRDDADAAIPTAARLLELIGMPDPDAGAVADVWARLGRTTAAPIGVSADGPFVVDLRADGPHGLIAGTTGAGKSELLQSIIASLAVANRPESMTFVLIDYKGGSAFKDCARLPHTVGMVSDLDGHLTERALASLSAELKRREEILLHAGAKDIEDYWDTRRRRRELDPLPRLVLIIDEFASLVAELPDFVTGLVGIAQRGRSLGVHLILATQRPAGVVSADIRANTNLRIALRVTDAAESTDVIDTPEAAFIAKSTPGRCYVRSGAAAPVAVQSARIGGRRPGQGPATAARVVPVPWHYLGQPLPADSSGPREDGDLATDLSVLVDAIRGAAAKLDVPEQRSPWLAPLPELVTLDQLRTGPVDDEVPPLPYGLTDVPDRQAREPLALDLTQGGHLVIAGAARTGRSTVLRTIAGSVAAHASPADVHIYAIDCGTGALLPVSALPHTGAVVSRDQTDRVERLLAKLRGEVRRRQQVLAADGFAGLAEQRAVSDPADRMPWMLLLLDWWEGFFAAFEQYDYGRLIEAILQLLREGAAVGLRAVFTTDRSALTGQPGTVFAERMLLRLTDSSDAHLAGVSERMLPASQPPGRVMFDASSRPLEAQIAMLDPDPSGPAQVVALRRLGQQAQERYGRPARPQRPLRVDALPGRVTVDEVMALDPGFRPPSPLWALAGAGGDELGPVGIDLSADGPGAVVAGPPRSGRSTALLAMAASLLTQGTPVLAITPRRSPLRALEGTRGVVAVLGADASEAELDKALENLKQYVVLVDDAELLIESMLSEPLRRLIVSGRDADHGLVLAGTTSDLGRAYSGFVPEALKSRCGLIVAVDSPSDGDLFGVRLTRNAGPGPLGRGLLIRPGRAEPIQVAASD